jgi:hypothetical protein
MHDSAVYIYDTEGKQSIRDKRKEAISKSEGIDLIVVPFWWDWSEDALRFLIGKQRPDLFLIDPNYSVGKQPTARKQVNSMLHIAAKKFQPEIADPSGMYLFL